MSSFAFQMFWVPSKFYHLHPATIGKPTFKKTFLPHYNLRLHKQGIFQSNNSHNDSILPSNTIVFTFKVKHNSYFAIFTKSWNNISNVNQISYKRSNKPLSTSSNLNKRINLCFTQIKAIERTRSTRKTHSNMVSVLLNLRLDEKLKQHIQAQLCNNNQPSTLLKANIHFNNKIPSSRDSFPLLAARCMKLSVMTLSL